MTKPTKAGPTRPLTSAGSLDGGGGTLFGGAVSSGLVPTSTGSNTWLWLENVRRISVNQTTNVQGPFVNFADGSNTTVTVDMVGAVASNTIRVHATGGGSVSFGSNATRVSEIPFVGAGSDSARTDHIHDGIGTITASSSNTMQRGTWNVRAGAGIALALTDTDGDGEFDTTTIVNTGQSAAGGGGDLSFIDEVVLGSNNATMGPFTAIPQTFRDLILVYGGRMSGSGQGEGARLQVGDGSIDTGSNYHQAIAFTGWTDGVSETTSASGLVVGSFTSSGGASGLRGQGSIELLDYTNSAAFRAFIGQAYCGDVNGTLRWEITGGWTNTSVVIERLQLVATAGNFVTGSYMTLYGRG